MKENDDNRWLDPMLEQHIRREPETFDFEKWAETHPDEARLLSDGFKDSGRSAKTKPYEIWRFIMESKVTKYSAAAAVILATTFVLFGPSWAPGNGNVVLADVQQNIAGAETMLIRGTKTFLRPGEEGEVYEFDGTKCEFDLVKYFSKQHGFTEEGYAEGELFYRITFNIPKKKTLLLFPPYKKYLTFPTLEGAAQIMERFATPNGIVNLLLDGDCKKLGKDKIDGVEVEGFEFEAIETIKEILPKPVFDIQDYTGKIWIAVEEQLPVRIEADLSIGKSFMTMFNELNLHEVNVLDQMNIEIDKNTFDIEPPEDYTEVTLSDILLMIPVETKAGLAGLGILPVSFIAWKRRRRKRRTIAQQ
jgi:hypothetical protein